MNSMLVPGAWCPVSTTTCAFGPGLRQCAYAVPVRDVRHVEGGLEELVLQQHPLVVPESLVHLGQALGQPVLALTDVVLTGIVRTVGEPELRSFEPVASMMSTHSSRWSTAFRRTAASG